MMMDLARDAGLKVEKRRISVDELDTMQSAGGCGTVRSAQRAGAVRRCVSQFAVDVLC